MKIATSHGSNVHPGYVRMQHFVRRSTYVPFLLNSRQFLGDMRREFMPRLYAAFHMVLWVAISAMLCKRAVPMLWHAFMFFGLWHVGVFPPFFPF
jgi:hypothetical protein